MGGACHFGAADVPPWLPLGPNWRLVRPWPWRRGRRAGRLGREDADGRLRRARAPRYGAGPWSRVSARSTTIAVSRKARTIPPLADCLQEPDHLQSGDLTPLPLEATAPERHSRPYPADLRNAEGAVLEPLLPPPARLGRPMKWLRRLMVEAVFPLVRLGRERRMVPQHGPPWPTVRSRFRRRRRCGTIRRMHDELRTSAWKLEGRTPDPGMR